MTTVCSWGGGKDSCLAYYLTQTAYDVRQFLTMTVGGEGNETRRSYAATLNHQVRAIGVSHRRANTTWETYTERFKRVLGKLEPEYAVFGTIDVAEHRSWVESVCRACDVTPVLPLWGAAPIKLFRDFLTLGFEAIIVKIDSELIAPRWLGEPIDENFLDYLLSRDIHPMGEGGEYQTLVVDGSIFEYRTTPRITGANQTGRWLIAELEPPTSGSQT